MPTHVRTCAHTFSGPNQYRTMALRALQDKPLHEQNTIWANAQREALSKAALNIIKEQTSHQAPITTFKARYPSRRTPTNYYFHYITNNYY